MEEVRQKHGTFYDFTEVILDNQTDFMESKRVDRLIKIAKFPFHKTLDDFDFSYPDKIDQTLINELASCRFIKQNKHVLIMGPVGVGKTHIAIGLGYKAIYHGCDVLCLTFEQIIQLANKTIDSTSDRYRQLTNLARTKLLIFDDIEYNKDIKEHRERMAQFSEDASDFLYTLIKKRYESTTSGATIFTFNQAFIGWDRIFGSEARAEKLIDRILDHTRRCIVKIEGDSYRSKGTLIV